MADILSDMVGIFTAIIQRDSWMISEALRSSAAWVLGAVVIVLGGIAVMLVYRRFPWIERRFEPTIMVSTYLLIGVIIFVEVIRRFVFSVQAPWSTTLPPFLFLIMTWFGCAYNVKLRTHLSFSEFRTMLPRGLQFSCLTLDALLWLGFCWVVVVTSTQIAANSAANFQVLLGTDNILQWWFLATVPVSFVLIAARAIENWLADLKNLVDGTDLIRPVAIGSD